MMFVRDGSVVKFTIDGKTKMRGVKVGKFNFSKGTKVQTGSD